LFLNYLGSLNKINIDNQEDKDKIQFSIKENEKVRNIEEKIQTWAIEKTVKS